MTEKYDDRCPNCGRFVEEDAAGFRMLLPHMLKTHCEISNRYAVPQMSIVKKALHYVFYFLSSA